LAHEPHMELVRREMLHSALAFHLRFLARHGDRPGQRFQAALAQLRVGEIEEQLGDLAAAEKGYRASLSAFDALPPGSAGKRELGLARATAWNDLALLLQARHRPDHAHQAMDQAQRLRADLEKEL